MKRFLLFVLMVAFSIAIFSADIDITGFKIRQYNNPFTYTVTDTTLPGGWFLIICRGNKTQAEFESL